MNYRIFKGIVFSAVVLTIVSCGKSVTNVWDYYIKNHVEVHKQDSITITKTELLFKSGESANVPQLEFIAFQQDSSKCLVVGSYNVTKELRVNDSLYSFDAVSLYAQEKDDFISRPKGDLSVFFTTIPAEKVDMIIAREAELRAAYKINNPLKTETTYVDFQVTPNFIISLPKVNNAKKPSDIILWIGKRKHEITVADFLKVLNDFKAFK